MTDDHAFQRVFGTQPGPRPGFTERVRPTASHTPPQGAQIDATVEAAMDALAGDDYRAFGMMASSQIQASCELRWWMDGTTVPEGLAFPYRLLMEVGFSGDDTLRLLLPDKVIEIVGERLEPLRQGLMRQRVTFIQQWSPQIWRPRPEVAIVVNIRCLRS